MSDAYQYPPHTLQFPEPDADDLQPIEIDMGDMDEPQIDEQGIQTHPDGSMSFPFGPQQSQQREPKNFDDNLAEYMDESELNTIAADLLRGIEDDIQSSAQWRDNLALGIKLLGTIIEPASTDAGTTSTVLEGQHKTTHPLLLEACLTFQANARASLLPAAGPVKIRDDQPVQATIIPTPPMMGHNGGPPMDQPKQQPAININLQGQAPHAYGGAVNGFWSGGEVNGYAEGGMPFASPIGNGMNGIGNFSPPLQGQSGQPQPPMQMPAGIQPPMMPPPKTDRDLLAEALETDLNHYLTTTDKGYYPDTDRMLFMCGLSGTTIKKVYNCPLKRRPVSESCPIEDFIVSNAFADLCNMPRITQRIMMRPSVLRRMQLVKAYRDIELQDPSDNSTGANEVKQMKADTVGVDITVNEPEDLDYELYECYCELELDRFAPDHFKDSGLALPYKVVIAKESQKVLEIRRNWKEDDEECTVKEYFVDFSYVKAFGFYGLGLMHILGNTTRTLTAAWREFIDSGMFANFPGFVFAKGAGRQLTNNFRVPPGGGVGLDVGLADIRNAVMPLPYHDLTQAFVAFIQHVEEYGQRLGGTANINVGEGRQDAPVGTTLAMIEQATKPLGAVLKRLHTAQGREFELLKERFKEDPGAIIRFNKKPAMQWKTEQFIQALDDFDLVPVSDPNNPTHMHRMAKVSMIYQLASQDPSSFDKPNTYKKLFAEADLGKYDDVAAQAQPGAPPPDPKIAAAAATAQIKQQSDQQKSMNDLAIEKLRLQDRLQDRQTKLQIAQIDRQMEQMKLASTLAIHSSTQEMSAADRALELKQTFQGQAQDQQQNMQQAQQDQSNTAMGHAVDLHSQQAQQAHEAQLAQHQAAQDQAERAHQIQMAQMQTGHEAQMADLQRQHEAKLHSHKVNTDAALKHHATITGNEIKRQQIKKQSQRKAV